MAGDLRGCTVEELLGRALQYPNADSVGDCVVFDIRHNRYRLITKISYGLSLITVVSLLTDAEWDRGGWKNVCGC
jgi:mRNA-degrading endonuclease HigB of HigAB toxin-antitoxin module